MGQNTVVVELAEVRKGGNASIAMELDGAKDGWWWRWHKVVGVGGVEQVERVVERLEISVNTGLVADLARNHAPEKSNS